MAYYPALMVRECPHCKAHIVQEETISGNTIGATYWTDGKRQTKCCRTIHGLLSHPFDEGYDHAAGFIRKLAEEKTRAVRQFLPGK